MKKQLLILSVLYLYLAFSNAKAHHSFLETVVPELDEYTFSELTGIGSEEKNIKDDYFVMFYASWCSYCQQMMPVWVQIKNTYESKNIVAFHCPDNIPYCQKLNVYGYPSLILFLKDTYQYCVYSDERDFYKISKFLSFRCENQELYDIKF